LAQRAFLDTVRTLKKSEKIRKIREKFRGLHERQEL
jgi:hypothetical protein